MRPALSAVATPCRDRAPSAVECVAECGGEVWTPLVQGTQHGRGLVINDHTL